MKPAVIDGFIITMLVLVVLLAAAVAWSRLRDR